MHAVVQRVNQVESNQYSQDPNWIKCVCVRTCLCVHVCTGGMVTAGWVNLPALVCADDSIDLMKTIWRSGCVAFVCAALIEIHSFMTVSSGRKDKYHNRSSNMAVLLCIFLVFLRLSWITKQAVRSRSILFFDWHPQYHFFSMGYYHYIGTMKHRPGLLTLNYSFRSIKSIN